MTERPTEAGTGASPMSGPLGRRLLLWFLVISLAPLLVSNGLGYTRSEVIIDGLVQRYLSGIANLQARHVSERLNGLARALGELSSQLVFEEIVGARADPAAVAGFLDEAFAAYPEFEALYVFNERGQILASAPLPPSDLGAWIGPALEPPLARFEVRRETAVPRYPHVRMASAVPLSSASGEVHYLGASVSVAGGQSFLQLPEHTAGAVETFLVDESGRPIFVSHPHGHIDYGAQFDVPLLDEESGAFALYEDRLGIPVLGAIVSVPGHPWRLVNEVPLADALTELRDLRRISIWLASVLTLLVFAAAWFSARRIVAPVGRLLSATRRLGAGDLSARVDTVETDEIGELGSAFDEMAGELQRTSARVDELHQQQLERAAQLATVGELAAGIAHEIKNPIAGISGGMDLIAKRTPDDPSLRQIIDEMRRQISRIGVAVRDLLTFARPVDPDLAPTDVNDVVARAKVLVAAAAKATGVELVDTLAQDIPRVAADAELIGQCLVNLLMNAVEASEKGSHVRVVTTEVRGGVELSVEDSGQGIAPDHLKKIFKPFFTTKHRGTGLGLSITADIIARHGGEISVSSDDTGSTFTMWLPARAESPATKAAGREAANTEGTR